MSSLMLDNFATLTYFVKSKSTKIQVEVKTMINILWKKCLEGLLQEIIKLSVLFSNCNIFDGKMGTSFDDCYIFVPLTQKQEYQVYKNI